MATANVFIACGRQRGTVGKVVGLTVVANAVNGEPTVLARVELPEGVVAVHPDHLIGWDVANRWYA